MVLFVGNSSINCIWDVFIYGVEMPKITIITLRNEKLKFDGKIYKCAKCGYEYG